METRGTDESAQKRAQAEQFSFDLDAPGLVEVTNESDENVPTGIQPEDHEAGMKSTLDNLTAFVEQDG